MNPIIVELDEIIADLSPLQIWVLKVIYTGNKRAFERLSTIYGGHIPATLNKLQDLLYIKIQGDNFEELICREKANILFKSNKAEQQIDEVLNYLNRKLGKKRGFSLTSRGNRKFISARLREGYTNGDMFKVINTMCSKWKGTNMEEYLRPETLFNETKFQTYLIMSEDKENREMSITTML